MNKVEMCQKMVFLVSVPTFQPIIYGGNPSAEDCSNSRGDFERPKLDKVRNIQSMLLYTKFVDEISDI